MLSISLINKLREQNKFILGVCDQSQDSLEFLSSIGVDGVFSSRVSSEKLSSDIEEFLIQHDTSSVNQSPNSSELLSSLDDFEQANATFKVDQNRSNAICIVGCGGTGSTEVAISLSRRLVDSILIDLDFESPSVGPRTGLQVNPNLINAIEQASNEEIDEPLNIQRLTTNAVIVGVTHSSFARDIKTYELTALLEKINSHYSNSIIDLGNISPNCIFWELQQVAIRTCDSIVLVGESTPVGILRVLETLANIDSISKSLDTPLKVHIAINKVNKHSTPKREIICEFESIPLVHSILFLNDAKELYKNSWTSSTDCPKSWKINMEKLIFEIDAPRDTKTEEEPRTQQSIQRPKTKVGL